MRRPGNAYPRRAAMASTMSGSSSTTTTVPSSAIPRKRVGEYYKVAGRRVIRRWERVKVRRRPRLAGSRWGPLPLAAHHGGSHEDHAQDHEGRAREEPGPSQCAACDEKDRAEDEGGAAKKDGLAAAHVSLPRSRGCCGRGEARRSPCLSCMRGFGLAARDRCLPRARDPPGLLDGRRFGCGLAAMTSA